MFHLLAVRTVITDDKTPSSQRIIESCRTHRMRVLPSNELCIYFL